MNSDDKSVTVFFSILPAPLPFSFLDSPIFLHFFSHLFLVQERSTLLSSPKNDPFFSEAGLRVTASLLLRGTFFAYPLAKLPPILAKDGGMLHESLFPQER